MPLRKAYGLRAFPACFDEQRAGKMDRLDEDERVCTM